MRCTRGNMMNVKCTEEMLHYLDYLPFICLSSIFQCGFILRDWNDASEKSFLFERIYMIRVLIF